MHVLFESVFYFYKFYAMEDIMYFAFNNNTYIYIYMYDKIFKLHNYIVVL